LIKAIHPSFYTQVSQLQWIFQTFGIIATDSHMLYFTQYKTTCLSAISSHCFAKLPAKTFGFNGHTRQNAFFRNLK